MTEEYQETEVKLYLSNMNAVIERLRSLEAHLIQPRIHEINLRFDTPSGEFVRGGRVLRLRQDEAIHLTYKEGGRLKDGAISRKEIEFSVSNFDAAKQFIESLGYVIVFIYEKFRTTYEMSESKTEFMFDELPFGNFVEIEGNFAELKPLTKRLGLNWDMAIPASYHSLFDRVSISKKLTFRDLTFEKFKDLKIEPDDLGVLPADA